jgi:large subunit ribosomal protein L25
MEKVVLKAECRTETGKGVARKLRRQNMMPAVLYGEGRCMPITLSRRELLRVIGSGVGERSLITLELTGDRGKKETRHSIIKEYQTDPVSKELLHVDFLEISLKKKIRMTIPIIIINEAAGVKKGGIMQQQMREVEIECLPTEIPEGIEVDVSSLDIGHSIHVSDLTLKEGLKILSDPQDVVLTILAPVIEEEAAPPVEEEVAEPEVVQKGKAKEEAEEKEEKEEKEPKEQKAKKEQ